MFTKICKHRVAKRVLDDLETQKYSALTFLPMMPCNSTLKLRTVGA